MREGKVMIGLINEYQILMIFVLSNHYNFDVL